MKSAEVWDTRPVMDCGCEQSSAHTEFFVLIKFTSLRLCWSPDITGGHAALLFGVL